MEIFNYVKQDIGSLDFFIFVFFLLSLKECRIIVLMKSEYHVNHIKMNQSIFDFLTELVLCLKN